jgi:short-subunit dehydrogenase involved in D-alanine esterification of teichoic acids
LCQRAELIEALPSDDILINNAGISGSNDFFDITKKFDARPRQQFCVARSDFVRGVEMVIKELAKQN